MLAEADRRITIPLKPLLPWQRKLREAIDGPARFVLAVMGRRAGKTSASAREAERALRNRGRVFWGAPTHDLSTIGREKFLYMFGEMVTRSTKTPAEADVVGGGRIYWRSFADEGGAIGRSFDIAIVDEAARVKKELVIGELMPTLADSGGKLLAITTPKGRQSWIFEWYLRARSGDPQYALIHGPSTENPAPQVREFCAMAREHMGDTLYRQEILAEFVEGEGMVFHNVLANATVPDWYQDPRAGCSYVIGCDVAKHEDYTVAYALDARTGAIHGRLRFRHEPWPVAKAYIKEFWRRWGCPPLWIDATGVGDAIYDDLVADGLNVEPVKFTSESKTALVQALMVAMEQQRVSYPNDPVLVGELEAFAYEDMPSGKFRYGAPEGMHDDCVIALALAVWGRNRSVLDLSVCGWVA